jgi:hypothetical protein
MALSNGQLILLAALVVAIIYILQTCNTKGQTREKFGGVNGMVSLRPETKFFQSPDAYRTAPTLRQGQPLSEGKIYAGGPEPSFMGVTPPSQPACSDYVNMVSLHSDLPPELSGKSQSEIDVDIHESIKSQLKLPETQDMMIHPDPTPFTQGLDPANGDIFLPERTLFATSRSKYQTDNCSIRGSLFIKPTTQFQNVAVTPARDLKIGAVQSGVIGPDLPISVTGEDMFVTNVLQNSGIDRLQDLSL